MGQKALALLVVVFAAIACVNRQIRAVQKSEPSGQAARVSSDSATITAAELLADDHLVLAVNELDPESMTRMNVGDRFALCAYQLTDLSRNTVSDGEIAAANLVITRQLMASDLGGQKGYDEQIERISGVLGAIEKRAYGALGATEKELWQPSYFAIYERVSLSGFWGGSLWRIYRFSKDTHPRLRGDVQSVGGRLELGETNQSPGRSLNGCPRLNRLLEKSRVFKN